MEHSYTPYLIYLAKKVVHSAEVKWVFSVFLSVLTFFFDPLQQLALLALFALIALDFFFGVAAARHSGENIRSAKLVRTAIKYAVYFTLIGAARVTEHAIPALPFLDETVTGFLAATELLSILENAGRLGYATPYRLVHVLTDYLGGKKEKVGEITSIDKSKK